MAELDEFLAQVIDRSAFKIEEIDFFGQTDWCLSQGALSHRSGGFFDVLGLEDQSGREQVLLYQPQSALTGLAICRHGDQFHVLLQARIEPGNTGIGQFGPTIQIQSTPANYLALHGGRPTPILDLFNGYSCDTKPVGTTMQLDLGSRYLHKSKWHNYVLTSELCVAEAHMIWVSLDILRQRIDADNYLNSDLRSLLAVFNWDRLEVEESRDVGESSAGVLLEPLMQKRAGYRSHWRARALEDLNDWCIGNRGIRPRDPDNVALSMYRTSCGSREVEVWNQPLMHSRGKGLVLLFIKVIQGELFCLLSVHGELGFESGYAIAPSVVVKPGQRRTREASEPCQGEVLWEFIQSDEGGRFYREETLYRIIASDHAADVDSCQNWVALADLKALLSLSNVVSFELRCIASALLFQTGAGHGKDI